nr:hypothetical protein [Nocardia nova]
MIGFFAQFCEVLAIGHPAVMARDRHRGKPSDREYHASASALVWHTDSVLSPLYPQQPLLPGTRRLSRVVEQPEHEGQLAVTERIGEPGR